jgi:aryl carrier-like protein
MASSSMENVLGRNPEFAPLNIQIVAAPDPIAGEVPVAVVERPVTPKIATQIQETLRQEMGREYVPDEIIFVADLGISEYPRTAAMKVKKVRLAELVKEYRAKREAQLSREPDSQLAKDIRGIWARSIGIPEEHLSDESPLADFADSITTMQVRDRIKRQTGRSLTMIEMVEAGTIGKQIQLLLQSRSHEEVKKPTVSKPKREGPPTVDDMIHLTEDPELFDATKELVLKTITPFGLDWKDVRNVIPAYDFATIMAQSGIMDSWNIKIAMSTKAFSKEVNIKFLDSKSRPNKSIACSISN